MRLHIKGAPMPSDLAPTHRKVAKRLIPFLILCYFVAYLDRVNLGFAALDMNKALGFSATLFGWGAGIFFIGYFIFEVPSNIILEKTGARIWIARIMITWGLVSAAMAFVSGPVSFLVIRFLLGAAEAGFFPGVILYLTYWFPAQERAKILGSFMAAIPLSSVIGAPISGWILGATNGMAGLAGWQWLFIIEAAPAIILGFVVLGYLTDKPADATWLEPEERTALQNLLDAERRAKEAHQHFSLKEALLHPRVLGFGLIYLGVVTSLYGIGFWMPQIIKAFGLTNLQTGFVTAIPFLVGMIAMVLLSRHSDSTMERVWHVAGPAFLGGAGFLWSAYTSDPVMGMVALTIASIGIFSALPVFWTLPTAILTGTAAAGGIAFINSVGNLGGFAGPYAIGWVKDATGSYASGMVVLACTLIAAGALTLALGHRRESEVFTKAPAE
jgi:ACS family tartrate transporter-like MFS transporter